jgi:NTE family protein
VGAAWETGLAAGLVRAGVDLRDADMILGTSAGASVGPLIALGQDMDAQVVRYRKARQKHESGQGSAVLNVEGSSMDSLQALIARAKGVDRAEATSIRAEVGRLSLDAATMSEEAFLDTFRYLRGEPWPPAYVCTTVVAETGEFVALGASHGAELIQGVAAGCSIPGVYPPITIGGKHYFDGGIFSPTYLDLAAGHDRILFVNLHDVDPKERAIVDDAGAELFIIEPDEASRIAFGTNMMAAVHAFDAVERGLEQGERIGPAVLKFWG